MLEIKQLEFAYGKELILDQLDLQFSPGEIHGVLGVNGAGKTTLFRNIYGFLKPLSGSCFLDRVPLSNLQISFLETSPFFYSYTKGREYLNLLAKANPNFDWQGWNEIFELPLDKLIDEYSTGMKKKLAFIGTLALDRKVLILDEPFNGVDIESNEKIAQILLRIKEQGKIIIISSHILQTLTRICDKISLLSEKKIQHTYQKEEFPGLEEHMRKMVHNKISDALDGLVE